MARPTNSLRRLGRDKNRCLCERRCRRETYLALKSRGLNRNSNRVRGEGGGAEVEEWVETQGMESGSLSRAA